MFSYHPIEKARLKDEHGIKSYTKGFFWERQLFSNTNISLVFDIMTPILLIHKKALLKKSCL